MAGRIVWTDSASAGLQAIVAYIKANSPNDAARVSQEIVALAESLRELPNRGRAVPEVGASEVREVFIYRYRVIYRVDADATYIVNIIHGSRLLRRGDVKA